jgi:hypothetical protein
MDCIALNKSNVIHYFCVNIITGDWRAAGTAEVYG